MRIAKSGSPTAVTPTAARDTAGYIAEMAQELAGLAERDGYAFLAYLLAMVASQAREPAGADDDTNPTPMGPD